MTFAIYQIQESSDSIPFYDVEFNNLIGFLETSDSIMEIVEQIEHKHLDEFHYFIYHRFVSICDYYHSASSCTKVYEYEFIDTEDLQENLRTRIQEHHPELPI